MWWSCVSCSLWVHLNTPHPFELPLALLHPKKGMSYPTLQSKPNPPTPKNKTFIYQLEGGRGQHHLPSTSPVVLGKDHILLSSSTSVTSHFTKRNFKQRDLRFKNACRDVRQEPVTHPAKPPVPEQGEQSSPRGHSRSPRQQEMGQLKGHPQVKERCREGDPGQTASSTPRQGHHGRRSRAEPEGGDGHRG